MMGRSAFAVSVFSFHSLSHCFLASSLMALVRVDSCGLWLNDWLVDGLVAAFFASPSACSFPSISACPAIHIIMTRRCGCFSMMSSTQSRKSLMVVCPDCLPGCLPPLWPTGCPCTCASLRVHDYLAMFPLLIVVPSFQLQIHC